MDDRKVTFMIRVTPVELRAIASQLEEFDRVCVNWYHTQYVFENEQRMPDLQTGCTTPLTPGTRESE